MNVLHFWIVSNVFREILMNNHRDLLLFVILNNIPGEIERLGSYTFWSVSLTKDAWSDYNQIYEWIKYFSVIQF